MSALQSQVIQSLDGLSDDNLHFLLDIIQRFMKPSVVGVDKGVSVGDNIRRIGSLEGQDLIAPDYDIDDCNNEIAKMFGAYEE